MLSLILFCFNSFPTYFLRVFWSRLDAACRRDATPLRILLLCPLACGWRGWRGLCLWSTGTVWFQVRGGGSSPLRPPFPPSFLRQVPPHLLGRAKYLKGIPPFMHPHSPSLGTCRIHRMARDNQFLPRAHLFLSWCRCGTTF